MKKNFKKKTINYEHKGYALYDSDLSPKYFTESLNEVISLHDVFAHVFTKNNIEVEDTNYEYGEIHCLDQISLSDKLNELKEKALKKAAEFKLIYFNGNLRGFYYRFNGFMFDERSVKKVLLAIEKQYFKGKYKQTSTSYSKWLKDNYHSFKPAFLTGQYRSYVKKLTLDEALTKRVRTYLKDHDMTLMQFLTGVIGVYYKVARRKDLMFNTNYFDDDSSVVGDIRGKKSYQLKKNPNIKVDAFIKNDWIDKDEYSSVVIQMKDPYKELKGQVTTLLPVDVPYEIGFFINEKDWEIEIDILCQKYKFKNDELFLMLTKLRTIIFDVLENDSTVAEINLITKKEEEVALKFSHPKKYKKHQTLYNWFKLISKENQPRVAFSGSKVLTFEKLERLVDKFYQYFKKQSETNLQINLNELKDYEQLAAFLALDGANAVYVKEGGLLLKKGFFGYKTTGDKKVGKGLYQIGDLAISKEGYLSYCHDMKQHFRFDQDDAAHLEDLLMFGIPVLLSGGKISTSEKTVDYVKECALSHDLNLKHVVTDVAFVKEKYDYQLHYGVVCEKTVPFAFIGHIRKGRVEKLRPVEGLGFVVLNKHNNLTQAFEKGKVFGFGPCADLNGEKQVDIKDNSFDQMSNLNLKGTWTLDGILRVQ